MISVIIPTFNQEKYLSCAIDSVLAQSFIDYEIIIVDDGSTDRTRVIVERYIKRYVDKKILFFHQKNSGVSSARNNGISKARGEYIAFLDSDDFWEEDKLAMQILMMEECEADMVYTKYQCIDVDGKKPEGDELCNDDMQKTWIRSVEELFWCNDIATSSVLIKKKCLEVCGGFDEDRNVLRSEDYDLWLRLLPNIRVFGLSRRLVYYREHQGGISKDNEFVENVREVLIRNYNRLAAEFSTINGKLKKRIAKLHFDQGHSFFYKNKLREARFLFWEGIHVSIFSKSTFYFLFTFFNINIINFLRSIKRRIC